MKELKEELANVIHNYFGDLYKLVNTLTYLLT